jgi:predicted nucleic acid-binding protein
LIDEVRPLLEQMRENGDWMSDKIVEAVLREAGE